MTQRSRAKLLGALSPITVYRHFRRTNSTRLVFALTITLAVCIGLLLAAAQDALSRINVFVHAYVLVVTFGFALGTAGDELFAGALLRTDRPRMIRRSEMFMAVCACGILLTSFVPTKSLFDWAEAWLGGATDFAFRWPERSHMSAVFSVWQAIIYATSAWTAFGLLAYSCVIRRLRQGNGIRGSRDE